MAVSVDTGDDLQQFAELVNLVDEFRWIWDIKLTHLLVGQHFKHFPEEVCPPPLYLIGMYSVSAATPPYN